jgi:hypothetical protein
MAARVHRLVEVIAFTANGIWRQRYELSSKHLQDLHKDAALIKKTHLKPHERFFIPNYCFFQTDCFLGRKGQTVIAVRKGIPCNHVDLSPLASIEATGACIQIGNSKMLLAAVCKAPGHT